MTTTLRRKQEAASKCPKSQMKREIEKKKMRSLPSPLSKSTELAIRQKPL